MANKQTQLPSFMSKGKSAPAGGMYVKIENGKSSKMTFMVPYSEIVSFQQHAFFDVTRQNSPVYVPCVGDGCRACSLGNKAADRWVAPVMVDEATSIYAFPKSVARQLELIEEEFLAEKPPFSIQGRTFKISRTQNQAGYAVYTAIPLGASDVEGVKIPDVLDGVMTTVDAINGAIDVLLTWYGPNAPAPAGSQPQNQVTPVSGAQGQSFDKTF